MASAEERLGAYVTGVYGTLPDYVQKASRLVEPLALKLFALARYVHFERQLGTKWVWSDSRIAAYKESAEYAVVKVEIAKVTARFEASNDGYSLRTSGIRSLEKQAGHFMGNPHVQHAAAFLQRTCLDEVAKYPDTPDPASVQRFKTFLAQRTLAPSSAAPGLSDHGRLQAVDFIVMQGGEEIASTETSSAATRWDAAGWTAKLKAAVTASGSAFTGPLVQPGVYEPWHYSL